MIPDFLTEAQNLFQYSQTLRRDFHRHPELGFTEVRTAGIVARELNEIGIEARTGIAETGVIALLEGSQPGPVLLLRFDMDALPIQEETGATYASQTPGVMHACGHDGHVATGLTVARILHKHQAELAGTIKLVFQPAEEGLGGAARMVAEGVLENPRPDYSLALHLWNEKPLGWLGITSGPAMAASEILDIAITGKGGHGAAPHQTADPILAAAHIVTALQTIVARNVAPLESAVVSICSIQAGTAHNIIPQTLAMCGTIRSFTPEIRSLVLQRVRTIATGIAQALNCQAEVTITPITPAVINAPEVTARVQAVAHQLFPQSTLDTSEQTMGSEDMAYMMDDIPGCYFFIGSANPQSGLDAKHHHPRFDFDEAALPRAAALMAAAAFDLLNP